jgi:tetratricopeptide (TPR) repeat protein
MAVDAHGLEATASAAAVRHCDRAIDDLLHFRPEMLASAADAAREDPGAPMAAALNAYLRLMSTEPADAADAGRLVGAFRQATRGRRFLPREDAHLLAVETWLAGDLHGAGRLLRGIARAHPRDALALAVGHQIDFFTGDALSLRDRIAEALPAWPADHPHHAPLSGMLAFGLEEAGDYERAEATGRHAVERDPRDVWGIHAVAHSLEMRARVREGLSYFAARVDDWGAGNALAVHNWWHRALFALEAGDLDQVRGIYDRHIHHAGSPGLALELLDASALLWRLHLDGHDETARGQALARAWDAQVAAPFYAFNDLHAVMAWAVSGDIARVERLLADRERYLAEPRPGVSNYAMTARIGLPACRAVAAFARGRHGEAIEQLYPIRHHLNELGGSHAQRDALHRTLLEAALRAGRLDLADALVRERIHLKPDSPYNWRQHARLSAARGDAPAEAGGRRRASDLERAAQKSVDAVPGVQ